MTQRARGGGGGGPPTDHLDVQVALLGPLQAPLAGVLAPSYAAALSRSTRQAAAAAAGGGHAGAAATSRLPLIARVEGA